MDDTCLAPVLGAASFLAPRQQRQQPSGAKHTADFDLSCTCFFVLSQINVTCLTECVSDMLSLNKAVLRCAVFGKTPLILIQFVT